MPTTAEIIALVDQGKFRRADQEIATALSRSVVDTPQHTALAFERERMRRIRLDFPLDRSAVLTQLRARIPDVTEYEVDTWSTSGVLEQRVIDGETHYFKSAVGNLFRLSGEARARTQPPTEPETDPPLYAPHAMHADLLREARTKGRTRIGRERLRISHRLELSADAVPPGNEVRAWIPYPRAIAGRQEDIELLRSDPHRVQIAPESALQRTVFLTKKAEANQPTRFEIEYQLTTYASVTQIDPQKAERPAPGTVADEHLKERAPHVVFTPALRQYSERLLADETRAYAVAQKLFAAVDSIPWAVAREYSTISNISEQAMTAGHADCGQKTLLLISLLRLNGIPARWQSGWQMSPTDFDTMHDWGEFYLAPYGWMPMDVTHGRLGGDDPAIDWFYLGSIDGLRVAFNDDYSRDFDPPKQSVRSETVDAQRGEIEWEGGNLYFDQWDYQVQWRRLPELVSSYTQ